MTNNKTLITGIHGFAGRHLSLHLLKNNYEIIKIEKFNHSYDIFFNTIINKLGICSYKQSTLLNWKHIDRPFSKISVLSVQDKGKIRGVIILASNLISFPFKPFG